MSVPTGWDANRLHRLPLSRTSSISESSQTSQESISASSVDSSQPLTEMQKALREVIGNLAMVTIDLIQQVKPERKAEQLLEIRKNFDKKLEEIKHKKDFWLKRLIRDNESENNQISSQSKSASKALVYKALAEENPSVSSDLTHAVYYFWDLIDRGDISFKLTLLGLSKARDLFVPKDPPPTATQIKGEFRHLYTEINKLIALTTLPDEKKALETGKSLFLSALKSAYEEGKLGEEWKKGIADTLKMIDVEENLEKMRKKTEDVTHA